MVGGRGRDRTDRRSEQPDDEGERHARGRAVSAPTAWRPLASPPTTFGHLRIVVEHRSPLPFVSEPAGPSVT